MCDQTVKQHIDAAIVQLEENRDAANLKGDRKAARELALSITALEDAKVRATKGFARMLGVFNEVDLQVQVGIERAKENFERNVHDYSDGSIQRS